MDNNFKLRSDIIQDFLIKTPNSIISWGITVISLSVIVIIVFSSIISYPDKVIGKVDIISNKPPTVLPSRVDGIVSKLYFVNSEKIMEGDIIGVIDDEVSEVDIDYLKSVVKVSRRGDYEDVTLIIDKLDNSRSFGRFQTYYNEVHTNILQLKRLLNKTDFESERSYFIKTINNQEKYKKNLKNEIEIFEKELKNEFELYKINRDLYKTGNISKIMFIEKENAYRQINKQYLRLKNNLIQTEQKIEDLNFELGSLINQRQNSIVDQSKKLENSLNELEASINNWYFKNTIVSPIDGYVYYNKNISEGTTVNAGDPLFTIASSSGKLKGRISIDKQGKGKIERGQTVYIRLDNYPHDQYGQIVASVSSINKVAIEDKYYIYVDLPKELKTSYNIHIPYENSLAGTAQIITKEFSILERLLNFLRQFE